MKPGGAGWTVAATVSVAAHVVLGGLIAQRLTVLEERAAGPVVAVAGGIASIEATPVEADGEQPADRGAAMEAVSPNAPAPVEPTEAARAERPTAVANARTEAVSPRAPTPAPRSPVPSAVARSPAAPGAALPVVAKPLAARVPGAAAAARPSEALPQVELTATAVPSDPPARADEKRPAPRALAAVAPEPLAATRPTAAVAEAIDVPPPPRAKPMPPRRPTPAITTAAETVGEPDPRPRREGSPRRPATSRAAVRSAGGNARAAVAAGLGGRRTDSAGRAAVSNYRGRVLAKLRRARRYPADAERARIEGTAVLSFSIGASGAVGGVRLARSSGSASLDREAVAMVRRAAPFPPPPARVGMSFQVPIRFALH